MALFELYIDVGEGVFAVIAQADERIVNADDGDDDNDDRDENNEPKTHKNLSKKFVVELILILKVIYNISLSK